MQTSYGDVELRLEDHAGVGGNTAPALQLSLTRALVGSLADAYEYLDGVDACRVILLCSRGKAFCAGADFQAGSQRNTVRR